MSEHFKIEVLRDERQFYELRDEWSELVTKDAHATTFQTWEFIYPHWKYRNNGRLLYLITVRSNDGVLQAIAPFWVQTIKKGITLKVVEFIGTRGLDYLDFIVSQETNKEEVLKNIFSFLLADKKDDWNVISLSELRSNSKNILNKVFDDLGIRYSLNKCSTCVRINLPGTWQEYKKSLSPSTRKDTNYDENRFEKTFNGKFCIFVQNSPEFQMVISELQKIHQNRWETISEKGSFHKDWMKDLDNEIVIGASERGVLRYFVLHADGVPVAGLSGFSFDSTIYTHTMSINTDEKYRKYSIGNVLLQKAIKWSIENGYKYFDLSRGDEPYKFKFGGKAENSYRVEIYKNIIWKYVLNLGRKVYGLK